MSNYLAVATVTATMQSLLGTAALVVPGATVTAERPDNTGGGSREPNVNVFLYQVTSNAAWRNVDLPTRTANGELAERPQTALDLHYLLSFFGSDASLEPQRLLGSAIRILHEQPVLSRQSIRQVIGSPLFATFADQSNLAEQMEPVRLTPLALTIEELSKLWSVFFHAPFVLSIAYTASVVLIESDVGVPSGPPVLWPEVRVAPFRKPTITRVGSTAENERAIDFKSTLSIEGSQLRGERTTVLINGAKRTPATVDEHRITLPVPADLPAGHKGLQVVHYPDPLDDARQRHLSNIASFVYRPTILSANAAAGRVTVEVAPTLRTGQRVTLVLNDMRSANKRAFTFGSAPVATDSNTWEVEAPGLEPGESYLLRLQVDGAESLLQQGAEGTFVRPSVKIP